MNSKVVLLGIVAIVVGLFAMPETMALFTGQHDWYDTTQPGVQVPCEKCHTDIFSELNQPGSVNSLHKAVDSTGPCIGCHVTTAPQVKEGLRVGPGGQFHAAAAPMCLDCHSGTGPGLDAREILTGTEEVHKPFALAARDNATMLKSANEACISCHTHVKTNITWTKATTIEFNATESVLPGGNHSWTVDNFDATGVNVTMIPGG